MNNSWIKANHFFLSNEAVEALKVEALERNPKFKQLKKVDKTDKARVERGLLRMDSNANIHGTNFSHAVHGTLFTTLKLKKKYIVHTPT